MELQPTQMNTPRHSLNIKLRPRMSKLLKPTLLLLKTKQRQRLKMEILNLRKLRILKQNQRMEPLLQRREKMEKLLKPLPQKNKRSQQLPKNQQQKKRNQTQRRKRNQMTVRMSTLLKKRRKKKWLSPLLTNQRVRSHRHKGKIGELIKMNSRNTRIYWIKRPTERRINNYWIIKNFLSFFSLLSWILFIFIRSKK